MSAYNPPLYNNNTIQFNPTIYETGTTSSNSQSLILLKTDNIQCLLPNDSVSLYTQSAGPITLGTGGTTVTVNSVLTAAAANLNGIQTSAISVQTGQPSLSIGTGATSVLIRPTTTQITGTLQINNINNYTATDVNLYTATTNTINLGNSTAGTKLYLNPTLTYVNELIGGSTTIWYNEILRAINVADTINLYDTSTGIINTGTSTSTLSLLGKLKTDVIEPQNTTLTLGSGTTTSTYVKNSNIFVTGTNPTSYSSSSGTTSGSNTGFYISAASTALYFWSANLTNALYSGSIFSTGGDLTANSGDMQILAKTINIVASTNAFVQGVNVSIGTTITTTGITIGNANINPIKIQTSDRVVIGQQPSTYNTSSGALTGSGVIFGTNGTGPYNAFIDFYSYAGTLQTNSARIISNIGGLQIYNYNTTAPLTLTSSQNIILNPSSGSGVILNAGLAYGKGNLTSPSFTQTGGFGNNATTVAANSVVVYTLTWTSMGLVNFGTTPIVIGCNATTSGLGQKLVISTYNATTTTVTFSLYNPSATTTGLVTININFIATGGY